MKSRNWEIKFTSPYRVYQAYHFEKKELANTVASLEQKVGQHGDLEERLKRLEMVLSGNKTASGNKTDEKANSGEDADVRWADG